ncbi:integrase, catalytic region, zinc finger, CCHC-type containing protein [Tanacetum coccineum]
MYYEFREAFHRLFDANEGLFRSVLSRNMQNLEMQFSNETLHEKDSNSELRAIKGQFEHFIHSKMFELSKYNTNAREILQDFNAYTTMEAQTFKETIIQNMDSIAQCMVERASHEQELKMTLKRLKSGDETSSGIVSEEEIDKKELEAHYGFMAKIQEVLPAESSSTDTPLEQVQNNDENNVFANERQHSEKNSAECTDERAALANLIANLTLDTEENKTILKQLKKANASLTQELKECRTNLDETGRALGEATSCRDSCLIALQNKQNEFEKYKAFNDRTIDYEILQTKLNETLGLLALKDIVVLNGSIFAFSVDLNAYAEFTMLYLLKSKKCGECLAQSFRTKLNLVNNEVHNKLFKRVLLKLENHSIFLNCFTNKIVQLILFIVDSGCTKHMTGNLKLLCNFVEKFLGTVHFGNDQFALILGYGDLNQGNVTIKRVYYVEGLNHNLFSVGQFCDADLEVAFRKSTCFVRDLQGNDLLMVIVDPISNNISSENTSSTSNLFHRPKASPLKHCYGIEDFLILLRLHHPYSQRRIVTGLPKTLHAYFKEEGIEHQTSTPRTPEQNGIVERRNRTLVEAARTMLLASKLPLSFWAEAVATACYTQNRSIIISAHGKTVDGENLDKMKEKGDPCVMVGYSTQSKGYRVYNKRTRLIVESIHIKFDEIKEMMSDHNSSDLAPQ